MANLQHYNHYKLQSKQTMLRSWKEGMEGGMRGWILHMHLLWNRQMWSHDIYKWMKNQCEIWLKNAESEHMGLDVWNVCKDIQLTKQHRLTLLMHLKITFNTADAEEERNEEQEESSWWRMRETQLHRRACLSLVGCSQLEVACPQGLFGLVFGSMLSFTRTMAITHKVHSKNQNNFYWVHKKMLLIKLQQTPVEEPEFQASKRSCSQGSSSEFLADVLLAYQLLKDQSPKNFKNTFTWPCPLAFLEFPKYRSFLTISFSLNQCKMLHLIYFTTQPYPSVTSHLICSMPVAISYTTTTLQL